MFKKLMLIMTLVLIASVGSSVSAQDNQPNRPQEPRPIQTLREAVDTVADTLGVERNELSTMLRDGATIAEIIAAQNGDLEAIIVEVEMLLTDRINTAVVNGNLSQERADEILESLNQRIRDSFNTSFQNLGRPDRIEQWRGEILHILSERTGLTLEQIVQELRTGVTINELITANGDDPQVVITEILVVITDRINTAVANANLTQERADALLANITENLPVWMSGERPLPLGGRQEQNQGRRDMPLLRGIAEITGLTPQSIRQLIQNGSSLAQIIIDNGGDVDAFIADHLALYELQLQQTVDSGRISQAVADARLNLRRAELNDFLNRTVTND